MFAITGAAMITSLGMDKDACFAALCEARSGNQPLRAFDSSKFNMKRACEIPDLANGSPDVKGRATKWLCDVIGQAVRMSGINPCQERLAIVVGTGLRELRSAELWYTKGAPLDVRELHFGGAVQAAIGARCRVITLCNACSASIGALGLAEDLLVTGQAEAAIAAGCDSITESMFGLVDRTNLTPPERLQPFDRNRRGIVMGEGAAAVVLETPSQVAKRGAEPHAWLRGVGMSCDAHHETAPEREGIVRAMVDAHRRSDITPGDVDLLLAHGTGTLLNDQMEALAIGDVFAQTSQRVAITALKSLIGHTSGASGLIGVITAVECLRHGRIPPTAGLVDPIDEAGNFDIVTGGARNAKLRIAQVNAFGFGGVNAVAILERYDGGT